MPPRVLCTALYSEEGAHFELLRQAGFDVQVVDRDRDLWNPDELTAALQGVSAVLAGAEPYSRSVLAASQLRVLARMGVGFDAIDIAACDELGIHATTTPGVNHESVAEQTLAMILGACRDFPRQDRQVRRGQWFRNISPRLRGSTLGIVGLGRIGRAVAWRAAGLGMRLLASEPAPDQEFCDRWKIELLPLDGLLAASDYVSLHCPVTPQSRQLIDAEALGRMKPGGVLVNTSRGGLVDQQALVAALQQGQLSAAGLDVFETEPLPLDSPLIEMDNVLLSGHVAGFDIESHRDTYRLGADTIITCARGEAIPAERVINQREILPRRWPELSNG